MAKLLAAVLFLSAGNSLALTQADLDVPLANFVTGQKGDFVAVCRALHTGCGIEVIDGVESLAATNSPLPRAGRTAREILDEYFANRPHDDWTLVDGVLNLRPAARPSPDWLSKKVGQGTLCTGDPYTAAITILQRTGAKVGHRPQPNAPILKSVNKPLKAVTVRQALNALAKEDEEFVWVVEHSKPSDPFTLVFTAIAFREAKPGILNESPEASRVTERLVR